MKPAAVLVIMLTFACGTTACGRPPSDLDTGDLGTGELAAEAAPTGLPVITSAATRLVPDGYSGRYQIDATVLQDRDHGPQICMMTTASLPPRCGGTDLLGWSWQKVEHESHGATRWGHYRITGTYDRTRFTVSEVSQQVTIIETPTPHERGDQTPCPPPPGGWRPVEPTKTTSAAFEAASALARRSDGYAGLWTDQGDQSDQGDQGGSADAADNPEDFILNVAFTHDLGERAAALRRVWGGALCVAPARYSEQRLLDIQDELTRPGTPSVTSLDVYANSVRQEVLIAWESDQKAADEQYGPGAVTMISRLRPIDPVPASTR